MAPNTEKVAIISQMEFPMKGISNMTFFRVKGY